jgi:hypothetical protein
MAGVTSLALANDSCFEWRFQNMLEQSIGNLGQFHETNQETPKTKGICSKQVYFSLTTTSLLSTKLLGSVLCLTIKKYGVIIMLLSCTTKLHPQADSRPYK